VATVESNDAVNNNEKTSSLAAHLPVHAFNRKDRWKYFVSRSRIGVFGLVP